MKIVLAGASGFLGGHLRRSLADDGHDLVQLVRRPPRSAGEVRWDPDTAALDPAALCGADAVVNLCGAGVEDHRWTDSYRAVLRSSRVDPTATLSRALALLPADVRPGVLLNASAVGFYGDTAETAVDESAPAGRGFFPDLCQAWEAATTPAQAVGMRVVLLRTGLVLDARGGLLRPLALTTMLFAGGPLAGGRQWMPWISMADWLGAARFLLEHCDVDGPVNMVGPDPARNKDFARALGSALHRPAPWPIPLFALRLVLGPFADEAVASQRVLPGALTGAGYRFQHSTLDSALGAALRP